MKVGCKLGLLNSNIVAYADDLVLLAPSAKSLQLLIDVASSTAKELGLVFNKTKTKCMIFRPPSVRYTPVCPFVIDDQSIEFVNSFRYLGFIIQNNMSNSEDIIATRNKFYREFNCLLRKFHFVDKEVFLYLFNAYCLQFYGGVMWIKCSGSKGVLRDFAIGYHKAIKKILHLSYHESNHYACQEASLYTFKHHVNKIKITAGLGIIQRPCSFIKKLNSYIQISSVLFREIYSILQNIYGIDSLLENDIDAIISRISFVQNHEEQLRVQW